MHYRLVILPINRLSHRWVALDFSNSTRRLLLIREPINIPAIPVLQLSWPGIGAVRRSCVLVGQAVVESADFGAVQTTRQGQVFWNPGVAKWELIAISNQVSFVVKYLMFHLTQIQAQVIQSIVPILATPSVQWASLVLQDGCV